MKMKMAQLVIIWKKKKKSLLYNKNIVVNVDQFWDHK